jgi:hypothetical protein
MMRVMERQHSETDRVFKKPGIEGRICVDKAMGIEGVLTFCTFDRSSTSDIHPIPLLLHELPHASLISSFRLR